MQRHYAVAITITMNTVHMAAATRHSPRYIAHLRSKQVSHGKYVTPHMRLICYLCIYVCQALSQVPPLVVLFCKILISIPLKSETVFTGILRSGIRYGAGTGYRCTALRTAPSTFTCVYMQVYQKIKVAACIPHSQLSDFCSQV